MTTEHLARRVANAATRTANHSPAPAPTTHPDQTTSAFAAVPVLVADR